MVSPSDCTYSKSEGEIMQILNSRCSEEHWLCTKPHKISLNSAVSSAHRYWNRLQLLLSYREFVKTNCSHSTTTFYMFASPLEWESQTSTGGASVFGMVRLVLSQWEPAIGTMDFFNLLWSVSVLVREQACVTKVHHSRVSFVPGRVTDLHNVPLETSVPCCITRISVNTFGINPKCRSAVFHKNVIEL